MKAVTMVEAARSEATTGSIAASQRAEDLATLKEQTDQDWSFDPGKNRFFLEMKDEGVAKGMEAALRNTARTKDGLFSCFERDGKFITASAERGRMHSAHNLADPTNVYADKLKAQFADPAKTAQPYIDDPGLAGKESWDRAIVVPGYATLSGDNPNSRLGHGRGGKHDGESDGLAENLRDLDAGELNDLAANARKRLAQGHLSAAEQEAIALILAEEARRAAVEKSQSHSISGELAQAMEALGAAMLAGINAFINRFQADGLDTLPAAQEHHGVPAHDRSESTAGNSPKSTLEHIGQGFRDMMMNLTIFITKHENGPDALPAAAQDRGAEHQPAAHEPTLAERIPDGLDHNISGNKVTFMRGGETVGEVAGDKANVMRYFDNKTGELLGATFGSSREEHTGGYWVNKDGTTRIFTPEEAARVHETALALEGTGQAADINDILQSSTGKEQARETARAVPSQTGLDAAVAKAKNIAPQLAAVAMQDFGATDVTLPAARAAAPKMAKVSAALG